MLKKVVHYNANYKQITIEESSLEKYVKVCNQIGKLEEEKKKLESVINIDLFNAMDKMSMKNYEFMLKDYKMTASITSGYEKKTFDTKTFKEKEKDLYNSYLKTSYVNPKLSLNIEKL